MDTNKMKQLAVAVLAVAGLSGCASTRVADLAATDATPVQAVQQQAEEAKVSRALPGYVSRGGYRMRRFAAVAATG